MLFQRPGGDRSFIPEDYSRLHTEMAESMMGEEEACLSNKQKKKIQVKECDISNGDGTVDDRQQDINDRKVLGTSWGTKTEDRKRAAKKMTMDDHQHSHINVLVSWKWCLKRCFQHQSTTL